jgi:prevent-host-death family protein
MSEIEAAEAKNAFSALLDRVERGEEVVITRRGRAVARLVPMEGAKDRSRAREAARHIRELPKAMNLGSFDWEEWKFIVMKDADDLAASRHSAVSSRPFVSGSSSAMTTTMP